MSCCWILGWDWNAAIWYIFLMWICGREPWTKTGCYLSFLLQPLAWLKKKSQFEVNSNCNVQPCRRSLSISGNRHDFISHMQTAFYCGAHLCEDRMQHDLPQHSSARVDLWLARYPKQFYLVQLMLPASDILILPSTILLSAFSRHQVPSEASLFGD